MKKLEQKIVRARLSQFYSDSSRSVIVNSVWYTGDYHQLVMKELNDLRPTHVFVIALLDPPIVRLDWFDELECEVRGIGYYPESDYVDFFALFMNEFYQPVGQDLLLDSHTIDTAYMCLNRKPHPHRLRLYHALENAALLDRGFVSMGGNPPLRLLDTNDPGQDIAPNPGSDQYGINNDIATLGNVNRWQRHFLNVVTETIWDCEASNFASEKLYKPVLGLRPFLVYAPNGAVNCLQNRGIEPYINDFKDITDADLSQPHNVTVFLQELCQQPKTYWQMKFVELREKLVYNQQQFKKIVELNTV